LAGKGKTGKGKTRKRTKFRPEGMRDRFERQQRGEGNTNYIKGDGKDTEVGRLSGAGQQKKNLHQGSFAKKTEAGVKGEDERAGKQKGKDTGRKYGERFTQGSLYGEKKGGKKNNECTC